MLELEKVKKHLNVDEVYTDDDEYIRELVHISIVSIAQYLNRPIDKEPYDEVEAPIQHAIRIMVAQLYAHREPTTSNAVNKIPYTLDYLLSPYRVY